MRIDVIIPVSTDIWSESVRRACLDIVSPDTDVRITRLDKGPESIESEYDEAFASPYVIKAAEQLGANGAEGIIVYCFGEPGLHALKEKLKIPVVGIREAAVSTAKILGDNIGIISTLNTATPRHRRVLRNEVKKVVSVDMPVLEFVNFKILEERIENKVKELISAGCDVVVLGCGSMLNINVAKIQEQYEIPIVIPLYAAVGMCEFLIKSHLSQSKIAYPFPPIKVIK